ncbi:hypothetical protein FACS189476_10160 [Spirochaetia bacterium]|nr:hypothetical protein FACS189476_10160 [Spirochaetia bacterium]
MMVRPGDFRSVKLGIHITGDVELPPDIRKIPVPEKIRPALKGPPAVIKEKIIKPFALEPNIPPLAEDISKNISITTEIFFSTDFEHVSYNAPRLLIAYEGRQDVIGLFSVSGTDRRFELSDGQLIWADNNVRFTGVWSMSF